MPKPSHPAPEAAAAAPIIDYFVCVGAQKAGTTWLAQMLARNPHVFVTPVKELHYFDHVAGITRHLADRRRRSRYRKYLQKLATQWARFPEHRAVWDWYRRYMASPVDDAWYRSLHAGRLGRRWSGEATPEYALLGPDGYRHLQRLSPSARVVFIMRNPVRQTWSQVLHQCRSDGIDAATLSDAELIARARAPRRRALGDYPATLGALDAVFPRAQIGLEFYEDIHADRLAAIERICGFIGAPFEGAWFADSGRSVNTSQDVPMPDAVRDHLRSELRDVATGVAARAGRLPVSWQQELRL